MRQYCVYIVTNRGNRVLYTGITSDLKKRVWQHREKAVPGFTSRYNVVKLVWYESTSCAYSAISREKQIKAGPRRRKIELIEQANPGWKDLYPEL